MNLTTLFLFRSAVDAWNASVSGFSIESLDITSHIKHQALHNSCLHNLPRHREKEEGEKEEGEEEEEMRQLCWDLPSDFQIHVGDDCWIVDSSDEVCISGFDINESFVVGACVELACGAERGRSFINIESSIRTDGQT